MTATALIIDDEPDIRELIAMTLTRMGLDHHGAANLDEARTLLNTYNFDVCLTDMRLPDGNGVEFVRYIQSTKPSLPVAVITAHGNLEAAVDAMKNGAFDFVSKPVDIQQLRQLVVQAIALNSSDAKESASNDQQYNVNDNDLSAVKTPDIDVDASLSNKITDKVAGLDTGELANSATEQPHSNLHALSGRQDASTNNKLHPQLLSASGLKLVGNSKPMLELRSMIVKVARNNAPVWITGESGTGKELIARLIHENSPRAQHAFVAINCGAIPNELMESEFFGHMKGSFTGAASDKQGLFQLANGGTLFLDEVAELPLHMQVKLLRAIQERSVRPVGGSHEIPVNARILSASHKNLAAEVDASRFRHDLYYRLNVISLNSPSLRQRAEDIPALCSNIIEKLTHSEYQDKNGTVTLSADALDALAQYSFPGNVRELENLLERALALVDSDVITASDLQLPAKTTNTNARDPINSDTPHSTITEAANPASEAARIVEALNFTRWNRKQAASNLGLTYRQLRYRIQQLGIDKERD